MMKYVTFKRDTGAIGVGGSRERVWTPLEGLVRVPASYTPERGRERVQAGRLQSQTAGMITVQGCNAIRGVTSADIVVVHEQSGDVDHVIHAITNPDQNQALYELTIETGVSLS